MAEDKKKTKVDPTKIIVKGPTFEYNKSFSGKILAQKKENEKKKGKGK